MTRRGLLSLPFAAATAALKRRPNIILMMADDLGISDIGCYGGEIRTPNLDRLAAGGLRFAEFYNCARCCPTRASLMTGLYPHQAGVGHMMEDRGFPSYRGDLNSRCVTIAQVLRQSGYRTAMSGKWHVTPVNQNKHNWPLQRGFERYFGTIHGAGDFFNPVSLTRDNEPVAPESRDFYYTDAISDNAVSYIGGFSEASDPFFLYVAYTAPHWPLHALAADVDRYRGRYKDGWDALRLERHRRMVSLGLTDSRWKVAPRDPAVPAWTEAPDKDWEQRRMEVYAAQVDRMDQGVGRIIAALEKAGQIDNTLVLFLADNGGCAEVLGYRSGGLHIPKATRHGKAVQVGNRPGLMPGTDETYQSYGIGWANASNTPFRMYKHWVHEGGISSPFIAHWPEGIRARRGSWVRGTYGHLVDVMATCVDLAGANYPGSAVPMEGRSLKPALDGKHVSRPAPLFWEHEGNRAVRDGRWKLVSRYDNESRWELYDMQADRTEMNDLAVRHPDRVAALSSRWHGWAQRVGVQPWNRVQSGA